MLASLTESGSDTEFNILKILDVNLGGSHDGEGLSYGLLGRSGDDSVGGGLKLERDGGGAAVEGTQGHVGRRLLGGVLEETDEGEVLGVFIGDEAAVLSEALARAGAEEQLGKGVRGAESV